ncbi:hypothetical protein [Streptomyces eurythermus]|uniref:hypothetical protein n=1 Tax=Streptomyces eurythermus TaxID=42237 RepID=UPI0036D39902
MGQDTSPGWQGSSGEWLCTRMAARELRDALAGFEVLLPADNGELDAYACRPEMILALLEAAGYPVPALRELGTGDYPAFVEHVRDLVRRDLVEYGIQARGCDRLLGRPASVGIAETEAAGLTGLSRNTVREVIRT